MGKTIRFSVSMDSDLVELLDKLTKQGGHQNRSETLRGLVRKEVIDRSPEGGEREVIGTLTLLYHHQSPIPRVPIDPYPSIRITANLKLHAEQEIRVKVLTLKGKEKEVRTWAQKLLNSKNIMGKLNIAATEELYKELLRE